MKKMMLGTFIWFYTCWIAIYAILLIMENDILEFVAPVEDKMQGIIKVVGVGGD